MGVGHVPPGSLREAGEGDDLPRREHRGAGALLAHLSRAPRSVAQFGESLATQVLSARGITIVGRNVRVGKSELDIVGREDGTLVAFEVKTVIVRHPADDGIHQMSPEKLAAVRRGIRGLGSRAGRVDVVTIALDRDGASVRWVRDARW